MRKRFRPQIQLNHEFELDLAPLLAVMVKLVPVLLVSSAFVNVAVIETDLPQPVKAAIQKQDSTPDRTLVQVRILKSREVSLWIQKGNDRKESRIPANADGGIDLPSLHTQLVEVKKQNPEVYRLELAPDESLTHGQITSVIDEARKAHDPNITFPVVDEAGKPTTTNFLFPDVVFVNLMEG